MVRIENICMKKRMFDWIMCAGVVFLCAGIGAACLAKKKKTSATMIISKTDGPTSIFLAGKLK